MNLLNLPDWNIVQVRENKHDYVVEATYGVEAPACIHCHAVGRLYRHGTRPQRVMDVPTHGKRMGIDVVRSRWRCRDCGKTFLQPLPDVADSGTMTKRLVAYIESQSLRRPFTHIAEEVGVAEGTVRNVFNDYIAYLDAHVKFVTPEWLGLDELYLLGKPRCVLYNVKLGTIVDVLADRNKPTLNQRLFWMEDKERVKVVTMDMYRPYRDAVRKLLPDADVVIDKFHVVRMATNALEEIRRKMRDTMSPGDRRKLMRSRFLLLKRHRDLSPEARDTVQSWTSGLPTLSAAYATKEAFYAIFDLKDRVQALKAYNHWRDHIPPEVMGAFRPVITSVDNWEREVFAYFDHRATNAVAEALNGVARVINRDGRGYSFQAMRAKMIYRKHGKDEKGKFGSAAAAATTDEVMGRDEVPSKPLAGVELKVYLERLFHDLNLEAMPSGPILG